MIWASAPFCSQEYIAFRVIRERDRFSGVCVFSCVWVLCLHVSVNQIHEVLLKRVSDSLGLELQMVVRHHVGAGNEI